MVNLVMIKHDDIEAVHLSELIAVLSKNPEHLGETAEVPLGAELDQIYTPDDQLVCRSARQEPQPHQELADRAGWRRRTDPG